MTYDSRDRWGDDEEGLSYRVGTPENIRLTDKGRARLAADDPRAALAEAMAYHGSSPKHAEQYLAERGVLLVSKAEYEELLRLLDALAHSLPGHVPNPVQEPLNEARAFLHARQFAALSSEVTEKTPGHGVGCNCVNCEPGPFAP